MEIKAYRAVNKGSLDGYLDVYIPELQWTICGCGMFVNGDRQWVNMPARSIKGGDGNTVYQDIIAMSKELKAKFSTSALQAYKKYKQMEVDEPDFFDYCPIP